MRNLKIKRFFFITPRIYYLVYLRELQCSDRRAARHCTDTNTLSFFVFTEPYKEQWMKGGPLARGQRICY